METLLARLGFVPTNTRKNGNELWYKSPFREEKTSSFKITVPYNSWYDFGLGKGGNILDFVMAYYNQDLQGALITVDRLFTGEKKIRLKKTIAKESRGEGIELIKTQPLKHQALQEYLDSRRIPWVLAQRYLQQVHFLVKGKKYFALGFQNIEGGWELRNKYFQGALAPKTLTILYGNAPKEHLRVFEGFMDFLSYLVIKQTNTFEGTVVVLNSLSLLSKLEAHLQQHSYQAIIAFLDNDQAGQQACGRLQQITSVPLYDRSSFYQDYKDLNAYLVSKK